RNPKTLFSFGYPPLSLPSLFFSSIDFSLSRALRLFGDDDLQRCSFRRGRKSGQRISCARKSAGTTSTSVGSDEIRPWEHESDVVNVVRDLKMFTAFKKIQKAEGAEPSEFEESVAQALFDLENTNSELKSDLKDLFINSATQIDISGNRKAVVIHVPYRLRKAYRKIHVRLVRELEKKFSGKDVVLIATRKIMRPPKKGSAVRRPRSRTLTSVHENILEDVVQPAEIVGKRVRYHLDGSKIMKIFLDPKARNDTEYKLESFSGVYRKLCGKDVVFEYPITEA
ncbi:40S ribosomal protein, partial [Dionaea muscipula]